MPTTTTEPVLVTGATGTTGRRLVRELRSLGASLRAASRHPGDTPGDTGTETGTVTPIRFDWNDPATHDAALAGVGAVYLLADPTDPDPAAAMVPFVRRAVDSGVQRLVLHGSSAVERGGPGLGQVHEAIAGTGLRWSVLRSSWFMQNFWNPFHPTGAAVRAGGDIVSATGHGRIAFVDAGDIARVAARAITGRIDQDGELVVTGPQALSHDEVAAALSRALGRPVRHRAVRASEAAEAMIAGGVPEPVAEMLAGLDEAIADGAEDRATDTVERVTGTAARSLDTVLKDDRPFEQSLS